MESILWLGAVLAGAICFGAGMLQWMKNPHSKAAALFFFAMIGIFVAMTTGTMFSLVDESDSATADAMAKVFLSSILVSQALLWQLTIVFPVERPVRLRPPNATAIIMIAILIAVVSAGLLAEVDYSSPSVIKLNKTGFQTLIGSTATMMVLAMTLIILSRNKADEARMASAARYLIGLWIFALGAIPMATDVVRNDSSGLIHELSELSLVIGIAISGLVFAYSISRGEMAMLATPKSEVMVSSSKASYRLLHRTVYLVEEEKPAFSFRMFADILKGRCYDCENDESFPCESLECSTCKLPCPCRGCTKYKSRAQGLVVTRQLPSEVRNRYYIQTTPILWLSSVAGKDNLDPAKISLLTDYLVNFMEKSHNGIVLVDGIEYLVTSSDFQRVLKAIDRWTETAMSTHSRLVVTIDPRAFSDKELALLERNREVIKPSEDEGLDAVFG